MDPSLSLQSVVRGVAFDSAAGRLHISVEELDELVAPVEALIAADPEAFPAEPGTGYRVAPLPLPDGTRLDLRYRTGVPYRPGETRCVLDHLVVPDRPPASGRGA